MVQTELHNLQAYEGRFDGTKEHNKNALSFYGGGGLGKGVWDRCNTPGIMWGLRQKAHTTQGTKFSLNTTQGKKITIYQEKEGNREGC